MEVNETEKEGAERRESIRMTTALPRFELDGKRLALLDFSTNGFRAKLPESYFVKGATGEGYLDIHAAGYDVRKRISFEVMRIVGDSVGVRFETLETTSEASIGLF